MGKEYEVKFLDIDQKEMTKKLNKLGGKIVHNKKKYIRAVFDLCNSKKKGYARVRDEAGIVTITVKIYNNPDYPDEYEIETKNDFETAKDLLVAMNLEMTAFQESYREKWSLPIEGVHEITFDTLPGLPTYMEIDCTTEESLNKTIKLLGADKSKMRKGAFDRTYEEYYGIERDVTNKHTPSITFKNSINELKINKNKDLLVKIYAEQNKQGYKYKYMKYKQKYEELKRHI
jgi:adenylate cyclase, class 2